MKFLNTIVTATAVSCLSLFTLTPVAGQSAKEILDSKTVTALPSEVSNAAIQCEPLKALQCETNAYPILTALTELRLDSGQEKFLQTVREALVLIDDCWTCVVDEKQKAAICAALRYAGDLLEATGLPLPLPSECGGSGVATPASMVATVAANGELPSLSKDQLVAMGVEIVLPCPGGCCETDFDFFKIVAHDGKICAKINGFESGVQVQGKFKILGNTVLRYDEWIGGEEHSDGKKCLKSFSGAGFSFKPCFKLTKKSIEICVEQRLCAFWGCQDLGKICQSINF